MVEKVLCMDQISFLGYMVFGERVSIDLAMIENVISLNQLVNTKDV